MLDQCFDSSKSRWRDLYPYFEDNEFFSGLQVSNCSPIARISLWSYSKRVRGSHNVPAWTINNICWGKNS